MFEGDFADMCTNKFPLTEWNLLKSCGYKRVNLPAYLHTMFAVHYLPGIKLRPVEIITDKLTIAVYFLVCCVV